MSTGEAPAARASPTSILGGWFPEASPTSILGGWFPEASPASILVRVPGGQPCIHPGGIPGHSLVLVESWAAQTHPVPPIPILAPHEPSLSKDVSPLPSWLERWDLGLADQEVGFRRRTRGHELPSLAYVATGSGAKSRGICLRKGQTD